MRIKPNNSGKLFCGKADVYARARPSYPPDFFDYLLTRLSLERGARVVDMGAGTGIFSQLLLERGLQVTAVEPNDDMRDQAKSMLEKYPRFSLVSGTSEHSGLPDASYDLVCAAQAFHWFNPEQFRRECVRILKKDGFVVLVWNNRDASSQLVCDNEEICRRYCPSFKGFSGGLGEDLKSLDLFFGKKGYEQTSFKNDLIFDKNGFIERNLSSSYSPLEGEENYTEYTMALGELFDQYQISGRVSIPNVTRSYLGQVECH